MAPQDVEFESSSELAVRALGGGVVDCLDRTCVLRCAGVVLSLSWADSGAYRGPAWAVGCLVPRLVAIGSTSVLVVRVSSVM